MSDEKKFNPFYDSKFLISIDSDENFGQRMLVEMYPEDLIRLRNEINIILTKMGGSQQLKINCKII